MRVRAGLAAARGARRGPTARCSGALLGAALWFAPGLIAVPAAGPLASSGPGPERIGALRIQSESPPAEAGSAPPAPPVEASRLRDLGGAAPAEGGALEVEAGQPFEWVIEVLHPAGFAPEFQPAQADAPGGPLDPERGWALIENRPFAPVEAPAPGIYRSRAVLTVAALAGGSRSTEAGLERVPERRLPDLAIGFVDSAQPSAARGPGTGSPPDFSAAAPAAPASPPGPRSVPGPRLAVRSLIAAGQSAPLPPLPAPRPGPVLDPASAWSRAGLIAALCLSAAAWALRALLRPLAVAPPTPPRPAPEQRLQELRAALDQRPGALPERALFYELSALLRAGLAPRHGPAPAGLTDEEWLESLAARLPAAERTELERLVKRLARAKYGQEASSPFAGRELVDAVQERLAHASGQQP